MPRDGKPEGPGLARAFDELRFGAQRTLDLRSSLPTAADAVARAESWLRERQVARSPEVLVITGRGKGSVGGIPVVREAVSRLFDSLRRRGVIRTVHEHTEGSFAVELAPVRDLFDAPRRRRDRVPRAAPDPAGLQGLAPQTRALLRELATRALESLGARDPSPAVLADEMMHQFTLLSAALAPVADRESQLRADVARAIAEYDER